ncbi:PTS transporter subunit EIIC [Streptococcus oralis]|uniref:PTS system, beta-glucoside-specific IIA or IIB or IIC component n=1 Tax=Streptococcus oralis TaxID=1303 RepID=A0A139PGF6_STROR|nr:PTS transporter subunit EIIC [Streptococcus oralis]KXT88243.1 PTS system, beta-glucoside-specific IIA or IIB or IIC component [Streptococcus oralis]
MAKELDNKRIAKEIIKEVGGLDNIASVTHCMTRLRFVIKDKSKITDKLEKVEAVLGVVDATGQLQIVLGMNLLPIYSEVEKIYNKKSKKDVVEVPVVAGTKEKRTPKKVISDLIGFIGSSVTPMVPGLVAGGMFKLFLLIAILVVPSFKGTSSYALLSFIANTPFYFMPIFVAFGVAKHMGTTPIFAMAASAALISPDFVALVAKGEPISLFGVGVLLDTYASSLIPAILISYVAGKLEGILNKIIPGIFRAVFVGVLTIAISGALGYIILGPIGTYIGNYIMLGLSFLQSTVGPFAVGILAAGLPFIIVAGIHHLFSPFMVQSLSSLGFDGFFRPALILHNIAEGGACFAIALKTKNQDLRAEAISCGVGCVMAGVTEPALYGIMLRLKKPLYGVVIGGGIGGLIAGFLGAKAFIMGYSSVLAIPIFQATMVAIIVGILVSFVLSFLIVYFFAFAELEEEA